MEMCRYPDTLPVEELFLFPEYDTDLSELEVIAFIPPLGYVSGEQEKPRRSSGEPAGRHLAPHAGGRHIAAASRKASRSWQSAVNITAAGKAKPTSPAAEKESGRSAGETAGSAAVPKKGLRTNRSFFKTLILNILTLGIYGLAEMCHISGEINEVASRHDGKHTMNYFTAFFLLGGITLGILPLVWTHRLCRRMSDELAYRGIDYRFGSGTFWGWGMLGSLILVGPVIFRHKFLKAMNLINASYNRVG